MAEFAFAIAGIMVILYWLMLFTDVSKKGAEVKSDWINIFDEVRQEYAYNEKKYSQKIIESIVSFEKRIESETKEQTIKIYNEYQLFIKLMYILSSDKEILRRIDRARSKAQCRSESEKQILLALQFLLYNVQRSDIPFFESLLQDKDMPGNTRKMVSDIIKKAQGMPINANKVEAGYGKAT